MSNFTSMTIAGTAVRQANGLFSLNDLHRASGGEENFKPAFFLRNDQTKALIEELAKGADLHLFLKTTKGRNGSTYACRELVIAYAAWISAAFHLKVIRVFLDAVQPQRPANPAIDYDRISPAQAQDLKELVHNIVDAKVQGFAETWARLHKKFRVNSYLELPATRFEEARDYLLGKLPEAPQQPQATPQPTAFTQALAAARENALSYMNGYRQAVQSGQPSPRMDDIPGTLLEGIVADALMNSRFLAGFDPRTGQMHVQLVPQDASVFSFNSGDFGQAISAIPTRRLPELQDALSKRVARHLGTLAH